MIMVVENIHLFRGNILYSKQNDVLLGEYDGERQVTWPTSPLQSCRPRIGFRNSQSLVPVRELSFVDARNNPFRNMTAYRIGNDSSVAVSRGSKSDTWTAALQRGRRLRHLAFPVIYLYMYQSIEFKVFMNIFSDGEVGQPLDVDNVVFGGIN